MNAKKKKRKLEKAAAADVAYICERCNGNGLIMRDTIEILGKRLEAEGMRTNALGASNSDLALHVRSLGDQNAYLRKRVERLEQDLADAVNKPAPRPRKARK